MWFVAGYIVLNICSDVALQSLPSEKADGADLRSTWICLALLFVLSLITWRRRGNIEQQYSAIIEEGEPQASNSAWFIKDWVSSFVITVLIVAASLVAMSPMSSKWQPFLVVVTYTILLFSSDKRIELKDEQHDNGIPLYSSANQADLKNETYRDESRSAFGNLTYTMSKPYLAYLVFTCSSAAVIIFCNYQESSDNPYDLILGLLFLVSMSGLYYSFGSYRSGVETASTAVGPDARQLSRITGLALCLTSVLVGFNTVDVKIYAMEILSAVLQAVQWTFLYHMTTSGAAVVSASSQLAAFGLAQLILGTDFEQKSAAVFVSVAAIVILLTIVSWPKNRPQWVRGIIMTVPLIPLVILLVRPLVSIAKPHPIEVLHLKNKRQYQDMIHRQSKTPEEAVKEYQRRYRRDPPPGFEKWAELALKKGLILVDEFDSMTAAFEPFYQLSPQILKTALERMNASTSELVDFRVEKDGISYDKDKAGTYFADDIYGWLQADPLYMEILPSNVRLLLNSYDEPKVVMPNTMLNTKDGPGFLDYSGQLVWDNITVSCPDDSPARSNILPKAEETLNFLSDLEKYQDVCQHREFENLHSFLNRPATLRITHAPVPIWSQARPSCFQDILFPSPYYEKHRDDYKVSSDRDWQEKTNDVYWVGSTTGGHATSDNWFKMQRQRMVLKTLTGTPAQNVTILEQSSWTKPWIQIKAISTSLLHLFDFSIGMIVQCEEAACEAERQAFSDPGNQPMSVAHSHKYVLDMDGNGFSGRYYRLLRSNSAVIKQTLLKEWHDDWLMPWVHYIPLSMEGDEMWEMMRYLGKTKRGDEVGANIAKSSSEWTENMLRPVDMELIFLRLMLEHANLYNREE